jgi:hypothetical protein
MSPKDESQPEENHWAREFMFGDVDPQTHHFVETLGRRTPKEIGCAFTASFLVSPLVSMIDKAIVQDISGMDKFFKAIGVSAKEMIFQPKTFFGSLAFRLTFLVYFGTYATANMAEAMLDARKVTDETNRKTIKVSAASVANVSLLMWRDAVFARQFSAPGSAPKASTPMRTLGLFAMRDTFTMYATFYVAPNAAKFLQKEYNTERNAAELGCALAIPMVTQVLTAPLHIHAMNFYQVPEATTAERIQAIQKEMGTVSFARSLRILPAFGIGSFSNNKFRELFIRQENEELLLTRRVTRFITRQQQNIQRFSSK